MMPFGHVVAALGTVQLGHRVFPRLNNVDWRFVALAPLIPDLIDKPLAILISFLTFTPAQSTRLVGHTLLFSVVLFFISLLFRQGWWPYVLALSTHLFTDQMWKSPATLLWPLYGWPALFARQANTSPAVGGHEHEMMHYLQTVLELGAVAILAWLIQRHRLWRWPHLRHFLLTGFIIKPRVISL